MNNVQSIEQGNHERSRAVVSCINPPRPIRVTEVTLQDACRSVRDAFFTDWIERNHWCVTINGALAGRFRCIATEQRIEFGHTRFANRDALRATIMAFYALGRNHGRNNRQWQDDLRTLAGKATFLGRYWLASYLTQLAEQAKKSQLPAVHINSNAQLMMRDINAIDLCFLTWPLAMYDTSEPTSATGPVTDIESSTDMSFEDSLLHDEIARQLHKEAS